MERAFGADFGNVRVHEGPQAAAMGALAYTQGTQIHLGGAQPQAAAHEAAHVVQQARANLFAGQY